MHVSLENQTDKFTSVIYICFIAHEYIYIYCYHKHTFKENIIYYIKFVVSHTIEKNENKLMQ